MKNRLSTNLFTWQDIAQLYNGSMDDLQNDFEQDVLDLIDTYNKEGLGTHDQVSILSYLCFELCNKLFMDVRLGYTHILSVLMQRMVYDMHDDQENKEDKKILH